jgi:hypothetical protein
MIGNNPSHPFNPWPLIIGCLQNEEKDMANKNNPRTNNCSRRTFLMTTLAAPALTAEFSSALAAQRHQRQQSGRQGAVADSAA